LLSGSCQIGANNSSVEELQSLYPSLIISLIITINFTNDFARRMSEVIDLDESISMGFSPLISKRQAFLGSVCFLDFSSLLLGFILCMGFICSAQVIARTHGHLDSFISGVSVVLHVQYQSHLRSIPLPL
jgi:hypothetical protein